MNVSERRYRRPVEITPTGLNITSLTGEGVIAYECNKKTRSCCHNRCISREWTCHSPSICQAGAYIGLLARGHEGLEGARRDVEEAGGKALIIPTDVADPDQVEAAAQKVEETFGPLLTSGSMMQ